MRKNDISLYANWRNYDERDMQLQSDWYSYLLAQTDPRTGVERQEDEGVGNEVFLETLVDEAVGIELLSWRHDHCEINAVDD